MQVDLKKIIGDAALSSNEIAVLEYLVTHLDSALQLGVRGIAKNAIHPLRR